MVSGGPRALQALKDLKLRPGRADYGPALRWERPLWIWFQRLAEHPPMGGAPFVRGEAWLHICEREGWDPDLAFALLARIEAGYRVEKADAGASE